MKYLYYNLFVFFVSFNAYSQSLSGTGIYNIKLAEDAFNFPATLTFNGNNSIFQFKNNKEKRWIRDDGINSFQIVYTDNIGELVIKQENKKNLTIRSFCQKTAYLFDDEVKMSWDKIEETRLIDGFFCKKAETQFRGRKYTAWYCPEINVNVGPWKFSDLPGLIFEVFDESKKVQITLQSIKIHKDLELTPKKLNGEIILQSKFVKCLDIEWDKTIEKNKANILKLQAQFPDIEINDAGLSTKSRLDVATELKFD